MKLTEKLLSKKYFIATTSAWILAGVVVCLSGCNDTATNPSSASQPAPGKAERVIFAVPLENATGQDQYDPAAAGLADLIAVMLADQKGVKVVERLQLEAIAREQAVSLRGLTTAEYTAKAGKLIKADTVLTGRLYLENEKLAVDTKLVDIPTQRVLAAERTTCRHDALDDAAMRIAVSLARQANIPMTPIDMSNLDMSPLASLHFSKALCCYYAGDMVSAIMQFMRTIDLDPDYIDAHYYSALAYMSLGEYGHAKIDLEKYIKRQTDPVMLERAKQALKEATEKFRQAGIPTLITPPGQSPATQSSAPAAGDAAQ